VITPSTGPARLPAWPAVPPTVDATGTTVAAFDVDGTLVTGDCVVPFLILVAGRRRLLLRLLRRSFAMVAASAQRDRDRVKSLAARAAFAGRPIADVEATGRAYAERVAATRLDPEVLERLRWHQAEGHVTVLVSASFAVYLRPLAERMDLGDVVGTELAVDKDDRCTGELVGGNCRAENKVSRLHEWLVGTHGGRAGVTLWAYGDSPGDRAMLADADHAVWRTEL